MMWGKIPDRTISSVIEGIKSGRINPNIKTYVFRLADGRHIGVDAINEAEARDYLESRNYTVDQLIIVEPMTINGMTINEIIYEAKKRGLYDEVIQ